MNTIDFILGGLSILSIVGGFKVDNLLYKIILIFTGLSLLFFVLIYSKIQNIEKNNEISMSKIKKFAEEIKIYERLAKHDERIKTLERRKRK